MKIRTHVIATVAASIVLMAGVAASALVAGLHLTRSLALAEARNLAQQIEVALTFPDPHDGGAIVDEPDHLKEFIAAAHHRSGRDIVVVDARKIVVGDIPGEEANIGRRFDDDPGNEVGLTLADSQERTFVEHSAQHPEGAESLVVPIASERANGFRGVLVLAYSPLITLAKQRMQGALEAIGISTLLALGIAAASAVVLVRRFARGVRALTDGLRALANGQLDARIAIDAGDEFGMLAHGFNEMAAQIEASRSQLDQQRIVHDIVDGAADGIALIDRDGAIVSVNPAAAAILGQPAARLAGRRFDEAVDLRDADGQPFPAQASPVDLAGAGVRRHTEVRIVHPDGWQAPVVMTCNPLASVEGGVVVTMADITELRRAEQAVTERAQQLAAANRALKERSDATARLVRLGEMLQACISFDEAHAVIEAAMPGFFGHGSGALQLTVPSRNLVEEAAHWGGQRTSLRQFGPADCWALRRGQPHASGADATMPRCRHVADRDMQQHLLCIPLAAQGETLGILHLAGSERGAEDELLRGVADTVALAIANLRLRDALRQQSIRDPSTGLFNRRYLEETGGRELHRALRLGQPLAVLMIDVDHFKRFNDGFGHEAGDLVLKHVAELLAGRCRDSDIAARYGGEEFAMVLPGAGTAQALERAESIRQAIVEMHCSYRGLALGSVTVSIGIAGHPEHGNDFAELLRVADRMLYRAKAAGRNRVLAAEAGGDGRPETEPAEAGTA